MTDSQGRNLIVCDNGTGLVKCGYADTNSPEFTFPSLVGTPQLKSKVKIGNKDIELKSIMCGDQAAQVRQFLDVTYVRIFKNKIYSFTKNGHFYLNTW